MTDKNQVEALTAEDISNWLASVIEWTYTKPTLSQIVGTTKTQDNAHPFECKIFGPGSEEFGTIWSTQKLQVNDTVHVYDDIRAVVAVISTDTGIQYYMSYPLE